MSDKISLGSAAVSSVCAIVSFYFARKASKSEKLARHYEASANRIAIGQSESMIYDNIAKARTQIEEASMEIARFLTAKKPSELNESETQFLEVLRQRQASVTENYINVYEVACGAYIDNKIDKRRFQETYTDDIKSLCEKPAFKRQMQPEGTSKYNTIWKVYHSWGN